MRQISQKFQEFIGSNEKKGKLKNIEDDLLYPEGEKNARITWKEDLCRVIQFADTVTLNIMMEKLLLFW